MAYIADFAGIEVHEEGDPSNLPNEDAQLQAAYREYCSHPRYHNKYLIRNHYYCDNVEQHPLLENLMAFYKRVLCSTLMQAVEDNLAAPVANQLSLLEELAITREIACEPLAEYSYVREKIELLQGQLNNSDLSLDVVEKLQKALDVALKLRDVNADKAIAALSTVKEFCEKAARIDAMSRDKFSVHTLHSVVAQVTRIISDELHENKLDHIAVSIEEKIKEKLVIPLPEASNVSNNGNNNFGQLGTNLTPEMITDTVKLMDDMIPSGPEIDDE